jgi:outer membrane immunogenic protein
MDRAGDVLRRLLLLSSALCAVIAPAAGADYSEPLDRAPLGSCLVTPRMCTTVWPGFYAGGNAGYTFGANESTVSASNTFVTPGTGPLAQAITTLATFTSPSANDGFIGGGQIGYNMYQGTWYGNAFVAGVETDIQAGPGKASSNSVAAIPLIGFPNQLRQTTSVSSSIDYLGTVRARVGMLVGDIAARNATTVLFYITGGIAYAGVSASTNITQTLTGPPTFALTPPTTWTSSGRLSGTSFGFAAGLGAEWLFSPNWSTGVEWLYYDLGSTLSGPSSLATPHSLTVNTVTTTTPFRGDILRASINYHF